MINKFSEILGSKKLTMSKVHEETGISRPALTNLYYERNKKVDLSILIKLCDYLNISLSELIEYTPKGTEV